MSPRTRDAEATQAAILEAAEELFLEQGFGQATTSQIAEKAGVIRAPRRAVLAFSVSGRVQTRPVEVGQPVRGGPGRRRPRRDGGPDPARLELRAAAGRATTHDLLAGEAALRDRDARLAWARLDVLKGWLGLWLAGGVEELPR